MAWRQKAFIHYGSHSKASFNVRYTGMKRKLAQARYRKSLVNYNNGVHYRKWR